MSQLKAERVAARVPSEIKELLQHAAALTGRSLSDFVISSARVAAEETIRQREVIQLTAADSKLLAEALLSPPAPNAALQEAFRDHAEFTREAS